MEFLEIALGLQHNTRSQMLDAEAHHGTSIVTQSDFTVTTLRVDRPGELWGN